MLKVLIASIALFPVAAVASYGPDLTLTNVSGNGNSVATSALSHPHTTQRATTAGIECPLPDGSSVAAAAVIRMACLGQ